MTCCLDTKEEILDARLIGQCLARRRCESAPRPWQWPRRLAGDDAAFGQHEGVRFVRGQHRLKEGVLGVDVGREQDISAVGWVRKLRFGHRMLAVG